jgi:hypothetical protein
MPRRDAWTSESVIQSAHRHKTINRIAGGWKPSFLKNLVESPPDNLSSDVHAAIERILPRRAKANSFYRLSRLDAALPIPLQTL